MTFQEIKENKLIRSLSTTVLLIILIIVTCPMFKLLYFSSDDYHVSNLVKSVLYETIDDELQNIPFNYLVFSSKGSKINHKGTKGLLNYIHNDNKYKVDWTCENNIYVIQKVTKNKNVIYSVRGIN